MNAFDEYRRRQRRRDLQNAALAWIIVIMGLTLGVFGIIGIVGWLITVFS